MSEIIGQLKTDLFYMFRQMTKEKESGLTKLIELLNEYENRDLELEEGEESNARTENNGHLRFNGANKVQFDTYMFDSLALSKKFGFIKWLVENKKIAYDIPNNSDLYKCFELACIPLDNTDYITMLLSIQDEPINFLISILK